MKLGYEGIIKELNPLATPFSNYNSENYGFSKAQKAASLQNRQYEIAEGYTVPDVSYVVEPVTIGN